MQRYFSKFKEDNNFTLINDDIYHITKVMRMKNNDHIEVVYENNLYICNVILDKLPMVEILENKGSNDNKLGYVTLCIPLLKEQKMDLILQKATELGVSEIIPVNMERCLVKVDGKEDKKIERWQKICKEAAEQSKRLDIPKVSNVMNLKELKNLEGVKLICSTSEKSVNLKNFMTKHKNYDKINIVVGPEGGISPKEEEYLINEGFNGITLGDRIMRVETVPIFILSALNYNIME